MEKLLHAINHGDPVQLATVFRSDIIDADGTPSTTNFPELGYFAVEPPPIGSDENTRHGVFSKNNPKDVEAWVATRHVQGEHWTLLQLLMGGYWWKGGVNVTFNIQRTANNVPTHVVGGGSAVDCNHGTVFIWVMGGPPLVLNSSSNPSATPNGVDSTPTSHLSNG